MNKSIIDEDSDLLRSSADTWQDDPAPLEDFPADLVEPPGRAWARWAHWMGGFRLRDRARRRLASESMRQSQNPEYGFPVAKVSEAYRHILRLIRQRRWLVFLLVVLEGVAAVCGLAIPKLIANLIDLGQRDIDAMVDSLPGTIGLGVVLVVCQAVFTYLGWFTSNYLGQTVLAASREEAIDHILGLPLSGIESASTGDLVTRVTRDVSEMALAVRRGVPRLMVFLVKFVLLMGAFLLNSWLLAIVVFVCLFAPFSSVYTYLRRSAPAFIQIGAQASQVNTALTETVEGARTVEALRVGSLLNHRLDMEVERQIQAGRLATSLRLRLFVVTDSTLTMLTPLILLICIIAYPRGWVSLGEIMAALLYVQQLFDPVYGICFTMEMIQRGAVSLARIIGISQVPNDRVETALVPAGRHLEASGLRFSYVDGVDVICDIDLDLKDGERLAVIGPSGSGKSTLGRLLAGINRPCQGQVTIGEVDVMDLSLPTLRDNIALVTQEHHIFAGSLRDNLIMVKDEDIAEEVIWRALDAVQATPWVERLPEGIDTMVGSGNYSLTPAQSQQIALARLFIADPQILVLDEATSLIDPKTARELEKAVGSLLEGRTVVAIAHRLHTARDADRIAVVEDGRIIELGSHDELLAVGGSYATLWRAWTD